MVILTNDRLVDEYAEVRRRWGNGRNPVQCIVGGDVDGLCALRVLMQVLLNDKIHPVISPASGPADVVRALRETKAADGSTTIFLINCGGAMHLEEYIPKGDVQLHLVDPHRPHHLSNVMSEHVRVWQDGDIARHIKRCQQRGAKKRKQQQQAAAEARAKKRSRRNGGGGGGDGGDEDDPSWGPNDASDERSDASITLDAPDADGGAEVDDLDDLASSAGSDAADGSDSEGSEGDDDQARMQLLESRYYRGTWYGTPSCLLVQTLASQVMSAPPDDLLWLASVSVAHFYLTGRMLMPKYDAHMSDFKLQIAQSNLTKPKMEQVGEDNHQYTAYHSIRLEECEEYHLFLLRHLSLWDALLLSTYVTSRLQMLNSEHGINSLRQMIHGKLGLKEEECKTEWLTLANASRREEILEALAENFRKIGCANFAFQGLVMRQGYGEGISACDMAHMAQGLLTEPREVSLAGPESDSKKAAHDAWMDAFYNAFHALDYKKLPSSLRSAVEKARAGQSALMRQCAALLQKEYVRNLGFFRYSFLNEASTDLPYFVHPLSLSSLARCVADTLSEAAKAGSAGQPKKQTPLLLLALDKEADLYTVVPCVPSTGDVVGDLYNPFGNHLRAAMESVDVALAAGELYNGAEQHPAPNGANGADTKTSAERASKEVGFDYATCMKVHKRDIRGVLDALTLLLHQQNAAGTA
eukprot:TRINITY_DN13361_c0_g2_i3.p1 TRINITY_DN13361_c0_g2~~TRINITY_DN13361_c0_g2_i3.p1  ORF type:complete len:697 (+),score=272.09 TRINITY_DN13361_c0_g2_i3:111-2201(+)